LILHLLQQALDPALQLRTEACSCVQRKSYLSGAFETEEEAARAYDEMARAEGLPETALNFPIEGTPRSQESVKTGQNFPILNLFPNALTRELGREMLDIVEALDFHGAALAALRAASVPEDRLKVCNLQFTGKNQRSIAPSCLSNFPTHPESPIVGSGLFMWYGFASGAWRLCVGISSVPSCLTCMAWDSECVSSPSTLIVHEASMYTFPLVSDAQDGTKPVGLYQRRGKQLSRPWVAQIQISGVCTFSHLSLQFKI
jgi:hypothetical protein